MKLQSCQSPARSFSLRADPFRLPDNAALRRTRTQFAVRFGASTLLIAALAGVLLNAPGASAQYAGPQYVQQAPNYTTYPQAKPSPYGYPAQPSAQAYAQPQYAPPPQYAPQQQYAPPAYYQQQPPGQ